MRRIAALLLTLIVLAGCMSMTPAMCASATDAAPVAEDADGTTMDMYARRNHASSVLFTVRDADTKLPLSKATVTLNAADGFRSYLTNARGQCSVGVYYYENNGSTYDYTVDRAGYASSYTDAIDKESVPDKFREKYALRTVELKAIQGAIEKVLYVRNANKPDDPIPGAVLLLKDKNGNVTYNKADNKGRITLAMEAGMKYSYVLSDQDGKFQTDNGSLGKLTSATIPSIIYLYPKSASLNTSLRFIVYRLYQNKRVMLPGASIQVTFADQHVETFVTDGNGESPVFTAHVGETLRYTAQYMDFKVSGRSERVVEDITLTIGILMEGKGGPTPKTGDEGCVIHWYLMACLLILAILMVWRICARRVGGRMIELLLMGVSVAIGITGLCIQQCTIDIVISALLLVIAASFGWIQKDQLLQK